MPSYLSVTTREYEAIFGKTNFIPNSPITKSSDYNCGAIANELEYLRGYIDYIINANTIDTLESHFLDLVIAFFLNIKRISDESDESLRNRFKAYMQRNANPRWSTTWSFRDAFSYFFNKSDIYILESYISDLDNELLNSDLENVTGNDFDNWSKIEQGSSTVDVNNANPFSGSTCAKFTVDSSSSRVLIEQTTSSLVAGNYKISLFAKADAVLPNGLYIAVKRSSDGYHYNFDTNAWQSAGTQKYFDLDIAYKYLSAYFFLNSSDAINLQIVRAVYSSYTFYVDRIRLGKVKTHPTVKVLIVTSGDLGSYAYLDDGNIDQLIDRADCESSTPPALTPETSVFETNATFAQDSAQSHGGSNSYKFTKTIASGTEGLVDLQDNENTTDMHGLIAGKTYTFSAWVYIPSGGILGSEVQLRVFDYDAGWSSTTQTAQNNYDSWQLIRVVRTIRSSATGIIIRISAHPNADNNEYFYVDDIRVSEGDVYNLSEASYLDNDYMSGAGGGFTSSVYNDMLQRMKEAGSYAELEFVERLPV